VVGGVWLIDKGGWLCEVGGVFLSDKGFRVGFVNLLSNTLTLCSRTGFTKQKSRCPKM
jgi:hypothetical protein